MKNLVLLTALLCLLGSSCKKLEGDTFDAFYNYDVLWKTLDERYCYFDYKNINWDSLYPVYRNSLKLAKSTDDVFDVYCALMSHLRDGHVNLYSAGNIGRYWNWHTDYPSNFSQDVLNHYYLGNDYRIASAFSYLILPSKDNEKQVGYIRYDNFAAAFGYGNLNAMFNYLKDCSGLIIDVRQNGGGNLNNATKLAGCFTNEKILYGYIRHKTGPGHSDFSEPVSRWVNPSDPAIKWNKPVVILTNRYCFSTTNDFACMMKEIPLATVIGDTTGGGGGMPHDSELPCGWTFRFSAIPMYDKNMNNTENGVAPDIVIAMDTNSLKQGIDSMIEFAANYLKNI